ncbi:MAG: hypothetical protein J7K26_00345 [Candidatus Aenigmarchaeota archaeon]|nr:hypothetical protein [Candidatus Aenigmarchaeota archaeon]
MIKAQLKNNEVISTQPEARELYNRTFYGYIKNKNLVLNLIEACYLLEKNKIEIFEKNKKIKFKDIYDICIEKYPKFITNYIVYKDLRERGLPVRIANNNYDFDVYERGAKPHQKPKIKWIVFTNSEDYPCKFKVLMNTLKLSKDSDVLWAIVDDDESVTYYIASKLSVK